MEAKPGMRNMLENMSLPVLLFLTTIIGGIILLFRYVVNRRARSSLEQDSSKNAKMLWEPAAPALPYIPIVQEPPIDAQSRNGDGHRIMNKKRNKDVLSLMVTPWIITTLKGHTDLITDFNFSSNGKYLASCAEDPSLPLKEPLLSLPHLSELPHLSNYEIRARKSARDMIAISSSNMNVIPPSGTDNNQYQHKNQLRNSEGTRRVITYKRDNRRRGQSIRCPMCCCNENTDTEVDQETEKQNKQADFNKYYHNDYNKLAINLQQNIPITDNFLCAIENYILTRNDLINRGYPIEVPKLPGYAMINNITYPGRNQNFRHYTQNIVIDTAKEKNDKTDSDSGNCSSNSDSASEHEQESPSDKYFDDDKKSDSKKNHYSSLQQRKRECIRCHKSFYVDHTGKYLYAERCVYHWGKLFDGRTNGEINRKYWTCCQNSELSPGCETGVHVWSGLIPGFNGPFAGYVRTVPSNQRAHDGNYGIYALDCEMCYTQYGLELTKITLVDLSGNVVYNTFVKPSTEIIDYNTRFSGITEEHMSKATMTLEQVQKELKTFIHAETILLGHNLASDFRVLRLFHEKVVDTTVMFPHDYGFPYCMALKTIARKVLKRKIQENTHDSVEDARVVVDLVLRKVHYDVTLTTEEESAKKNLHEKSYHVPRFSI